MARRARGAAKGEGGGTVVADAERPELAGGSAAVEAYEAERRAAAPASAEGDDKAREIALSEVYGDAGPTMARSMGAVAGGIDPDVIFAGHDERQSIESITVDEAHRRERLGMDDGAIEALAASIARNGLKQPVGITGGGRLIFGLRRLEACRRLGLKVIPVVVFEGAGGGELSEEEISTARAVENLQRQDLNPIEEAAAVTQLLETIAGAAHGGASNKVLPEHIAAAAERLGKSPTWVRDRGYLARLTGEARAAVLEGRLPLAHAREIAKLADERVRDELAREAAAPVEGDRGPMGLYFVKREVRARLHSLKVVPWRKDVPLEGLGGVPACDACPSNSANDAHLFEHDRHPDSQAYCLDGPCYERKRAHAEKLLAAAAKKVVKATIQETQRREAEGGEAVSVGTRAIEQRAERVGADIAGVDPKALAKRVREEVKGRPDPAPARDEKADAEAEAQREAHRRYNDAFNAWHGRRVEAFHKAVAATPGRRAALALLLETDQWEKVNHWNSTTRDEAARSPRLAQLVKLLAAPDLAGILKLEAAAHRVRAASVFGGTVSPIAIEAVLGALGVDVGPEPTLEEFLEGKKKAGAADAGAADGVAAPAKGGARKRAAKRTPAKAGKKKTKKKAAKKKKGGRR
jgi:ParB/RepB/Spo0J family partition protein